MFVCFQIQLDPVQIQRTRSHGDVTSREEEGWTEKETLRDDAQREQDAVYDVVTHGEILCKEQLVNLPVVVLLLGVIDDVTSQWVGDDETKHGGVR